MSERWRTGRNVKRNLYLGDEYRGVMDHAGDSARIVKALNLLDSVADSQRLDHVWRCSCCGEMLDELPGTSWRWNGSWWEHQHDQDYFAARDFGPRPSAPPAAPESGAEPGEWLHKNAPPLRDYPDVMVRAAWIETPPKERAAWAKVEAECAARALTRHAPAVAEPTARVTELQARAELAEQREKEARRTAEDACADRDQTLEAIGRWCENWRAIQDAVLRGTDEEADVYDDQRLIEWCRKMRDDRDALRAQYEQAHKDRMGLVDEFDAAKKERDEATARAERVEAKWQMRRDQMRRLYWLAWDVRTKTEKEQDWENVGKRLDDILDEIKPDELSEQPAPPEPKGKCGTCGRERDQPEFCSNPFHLTETPKTEMTASTLDGLLLDALERSFSRYEHEYNGRIDNLRPARFDFLTRLRDVFPALMAAARNEVRRLDLGKPTLADVLEKSRAVLRAVELDLPTGHRLSKELVRMLEETAK